MMNQYKCPACCDTGCVVGSPEVQRAARTEGDMLVPCPKCDLPKREGGVWSETVDYPRRVAPAGQFMVHSDDATPLFFDDELGAFERALAARLDPKKHYRLELRFFEVDDR